VSIFAMLALFPAGLAGGFLLEAWCAARWRDHRRAARWLAYSVPLLGLTAGAIWADGRYPLRFPPASAAFGRGWRCQHYGEGAHVCFRDLQQAQQDVPKAQVTPAAARSD
jgi:hypothetical protein